MKKFLHLCLLIFFTNIIFGFSPIDLRVAQSLSEPLGYNLENMSFSWNLPETEKNIKQSAYQIVMANSPKDLDKFRYTYDTGKVNSPESIKIPFDEELLSTKKYYWKVRIWDENDEKSNWSEVSSFEVGLLSNKHWFAKWISTPNTAKQIVSSNNKIKALKPAYMRKSFLLENKKIIKARLYVASKGSYEIYLNSHKIDSNSFNLSWTNFDKRIQSNTYDISNILKNGKNVISAIVADGLYAKHNDALNSFGEKPAILVRMIIEFDDGLFEEIYSDKTWKTNSGAILYSDIFAGEVYDANLELKDINNIDFDDTSWENVATKDINELPLIEPKRFSNVKKQQILSPLKVEKIDEGSFIFDFGENINGFAKINIPANPHREINIDYYQNFDDKKPTSSDFYICSGYMTETWNASFSLHKFRYVKLSGLQKNTRASLNLISAMATNSDIEDTATFTCSELKYNNIQNNIDSFFTSEILDIQPSKIITKKLFEQIQKLAIYSPIICFNVNIERALNKWCVDICDMIGSDEKANEKLIECLMILSWQACLNYGNTDILLNNYKLIKDCITQQTNNADEDTSKLILKLAILSEIAKKLNNANDTKKYLAQIETLQNSADKKLPEPSKFAMALTPQDIANILDFDTSNLQNLPDINFYSNIGGLKCDNFAWKQILFDIEAITSKAYKTQALNFARVSNKTPYGIASSNWRISDNVLLWDITIPPNTIGKIVFPTKDISSIRINGFPPKKELFEVDTEFPTIKNLPSQTYNILLKLK